ncbi:hypothetical protein LTR37_005239 [Vermiconidia calcicola]|uniref:Uncharacterized protein n=1 Tax=Vermiconidia calcicola TaxID=1690605 RepID=A0ACC3NL49_9PEZI|nr:hypothetical protein LTR37_005239 [Vermiconidia calcicola]
MPYTPPGQQSPGSSRTISPALSRSSSYSEDGPRSPSVGRPAPPRSMSSSSYLHKHRRSPSIAKSDDGAPPTPTESSDPTVEAADFANNTSVRQSPPPVNNHRIPTGAVLSPPDSSENSDGDEASTNHERGRELQKNWDELQHAVRLLDQKRSGSPTKGGVAFAQESTSEPVSQVVSPTALSKEARKISHSRSSTETAIIIPQQPQYDSPTQTSDDSDDDGNPFTKPSLVRKKSGELVKPALRPSSRRRYSSMPGTPTYSKSVHFNESNNQTRHFLQVEKPSAVSAGTSPVETYDSETEFPFEEPKAEREIKLANFPTDTFERKTKPVRVERIFLSSDKQTLIGVCAVQNISFHKLVIARFTLDYWKTTSEVVAEYNNDPRHPTTDGCDRFNFHIKLSDQANIDNKTLLLCVRYNVNGHDYWDNNEDTNYQVDFSQVVKKTQKPVLNGLGARPLNALPRSRHSPTSGARGPRESLDDDFAARVDANSAYQFGSPDQVLGESPSSIKLKPRGKRGSVFPGAAGAPPTNGLGGRYDFGASLSAALTTAQDRLGRQSGLMKNSLKPATGGYFGPIERIEGPVKATERPDAISTDRPAMGSDQYRDLVQKFCYFTPGSNTGSGKPINSPPPSTTTSNAPQPPASTDGTNDKNSAASSTSSSMTSSPVIDNEGERAASSNFSPFASRAGSPTPVTGGGMGSRGASPISFGCPYRHHARDGYLFDSPTPTAIHG